MTVEAPETWVIWHQPMQLKALAKDQPRVRNIAPGAPLFAAVRIDQTGARHTGRIVVVQGIE